jgi:hypothetical protein
VSANFFLDLYAEFDSPCVVLISLIITLVPGISFLAIQLAGNVVRIDRLFRFPAFPEEDEHIIDSIKFSACLPVPLSRW